MNLVRNEWIFKNQKMDKTANFKDTLFSMRNKEINQRNSEEHSYIGSNEEIFHNPFLFNDMKKLVVRLEQAVRNRECILVHGDYDVDGITATAIWLLFLQQLGLKPLYYIPNRLEEGYGLSETSIDYILKQNVDLLITVDCGITAIEEVKLLKKAGLDVIVTDHHAEAEQLPEPDVLINPSVCTDNYPFKRLCGASVALKCIQAICETFPLSLLAKLDSHLSEGELRNYWQNYLDLATMGTIADVMPIVGENKLLVKEGLSLQKKNPRPALKALLSLNPANKIFDTAGISFQVAPRINAAGRMGKADIALDLFMSKNCQEAEFLLNELDKLNQQRKNLELEANEVITDFLSSEPNFCEKSVILLASDKLHAGILGIVAARMCQRYFKPVIVLAKSEVDETGNVLLKGSARSFGKTNILNLIRDAGKDLLTQVGGHFHAAGLSIYEKDIPLFKRNLQEISGCTENQLFDRPILNIDYILPSRFIQLKYAFLLEEFAPYGEAQPEFIFYSRGLQVASCQAVGNQGKHLQLKLDFGPIKQLSAFAFNFGYLASILEVGQYIDLVYHMRVNHWNGQNQLQLFILDISVKDLCLIPIPEGEIIDEDDYNLQIEASCVLNQKELFIKQFNNPSIQKQYFSKFYTLLKQILTSNNDFSLIEHSEMATLQACLWKVPYSLELTNLCLKIFCEAGLLECHCWSEEPEVCLIRLVDMSNKQTKIKLSDTASFQILRKELVNLWN